MGGTLKHFLLVFDIKRNEQVSVDTFDDEDAAVAAYETAEAKYDVSSRFAVVLLASDSIETVRRTHGTYFRNISPELSLHRTG